MIDDRFTPAAIVAERPDLQPTGERYCELVFTGYAVAAIAPHHRLTVARFLRTLLNRPPVKDGAAYAAHREILGSLLVELEAITVHDALDEPPAAEPADLRDPAVVAHERELMAATRDWASGRRSETAAAYHGQIDELLAASATDHAAAATALDAAVAHASTIFEAEPDAAWLA